MNDVFCMVSAWQYDYITIFYVYCFQCQNNGYLANQRFVLLHQYFDNWEKTDYACITYCSAQTYISFLNSLNYLLLAMHVKHTARLELLHEDVHCLIITSLGDGSKLNYVFTIINF